MTQLRTLVQDVGLLLTLGHANMKLKLAVLQVGPEEAKDSIQHRLQPLCDYGILGYDVSSVRIVQLWLHDTHALGHGRFFAWKGVDEALPTDKKCILLHRLVLSRRKADRGRFGLYRLGSSFGTGNRILMENTGAAQCSEFEATRGSCLWSRWC